MKKDDWRPGHAAMSGTVAQTERRVMRRDRGAPVTLVLALSDAVVGS